MTNPGIPNYPPPDDWDWTKDGTSALPLPRRRLHPPLRPSPPRPTATHRRLHTEHTLELALGLLKAIDQLGTHQQLIGDIETAFSDPDNE